MMLKLIAALAKLLGVSEPVAWLISLGVAAGLVTGVVAYIRHGGEKAGEAKITKKVEKAHTKAVKQAQQDQTHAQATADAIGEHLKHADDATTTLVLSKIGDMHNAIDSAPDGDGTPPVIDGDAVRAPLDALRDSAERAAEAADAQP